MLENEGEAVPTLVGPEAMKLALFSTSTTLLPIDSDYSWGQFTTEHGWTDPVEFARRNDEFFAHYQAGARRANTCVSRSTPCAVNSLPGPPGARAFMAG